jgi:hypothetical protein
MTWQRLKKLILLQNSFPKYEELSLRLKVVLCKVGWALNPCPLIKSPYYLPWLLIFCVSDEKLVTSQLYKND